MRNDGASICFVTSEYPPVPGGVSTSARRIVAYLAGAGYRVHVFAPGPRDLAGVTIGDEGGVTVTRVPPPADAFELGRLAYREVAKADRQRPFDLFHGFYMAMGFACLSTAKRGSRPLLASIRGSDATEWIEDPAKVPFVKAVLEQAGWVTSVSTDLLDRASAVCRLDGRSSVILNAIAPSAPPSWQPNAGNRGVVGTVGEFRESKGTLQLIDAYSRLPSGMRQRLCLIGYYASDDYRTRCEAAIRANDLESGVSVTGLLGRNEVAASLPGLRVYVQPSLTDGFPNALLEAAAAGVPLVAYRTGGMRDVLVDGENALVVSPGDVAGLARAIERVLIDDDLAIRLGRAARALAERCHPAQEQAAWLALYERLLARESAQSIASSPSRQ